MKVLNLKGEVGWEINSYQVEDFLKSAKGEDITVYLSSFGGSVQEGFQIYNLIKNYKGKTKIVLGGICASIASYIPLAFNEIEITDNAVFMIHNPWTCSMGDYRDMEKTSNVLKGLRDVLVNAYAKFSGKKKDEVKSLMDNETWYFGKEIIDNNFAHGFYKGGDLEEEYKKEEDEENSSYQNRIKSLFASKYEEIKNKLKDKNEDVKGLLNLIEEPVNIDEKRVNNKVSNNVKKEKTMTKEEILAQFPEVYNEIKQEGIDAEKSRVKAHLKMKDVAQDKVLEFIENGASILNEEVQASYLHAKVLSGVKGQLEGHAEEDLSVADEDRNKGKVEEEPQEETVEEIVARLEKIK